MCCNTVDVGISVIRVFLCISSFKSYVYHPIFCTWYDACYLTLSWCVCYLCYDIIAFVSEKSCLTVCLTCLSRVPMLTGSHGGCHIATGPVGLGALFLPLLGSPGFFTSGGGRVPRPGNTIPGPIWPGKGHHGGHQVSEKGGCPQIF